MSVNEVTVPKPPPSYPRGWGGSGGGGTILACMSMLQSPKNRPIQAPMRLFGDDTAVERLENRIAELENAHDKLGRTIRSLELEYVELYDKVKRQMSRMAKRAAVDERELNDEPLIEPPDDGLDPISRGILARRGKGRIQT